MIEGMTFHHHGLALGTDNDALIFLNALGYRCGDMVHDLIQDVRLRLCTHESMPTVEIVMPGDSPGPLDAILSRHQQLIYHTCYEIDDRERVIEALEAADLRVLPVLPPTPAILFGGRKVSFHTVMGVGLVELLDRI